MPYERTCQEKGNITLRYCRGQSNLIDIYWSRLYDREKLEAMEEYTQCSDPTCIGTINEEGECNICSNSTSGNLPSWQSLFAKHVAKNKTLEDWWKGKFKSLIETVGKFSEYCEEDKLPVTSRAILRATRFIHVLDRRGLLTDRYYNFSLKESTRPNCISINLDHNFNLEIMALPEGGISFRWQGGSIQVIIPPEPRIEMRCSYYDSYNGEKIFYTNNYDKIADRLEKLFPWVNEN